MTFGIKSLTGRSRTKKSKARYQPVFPLIYDGGAGPYRSLSRLEESLQRDFEILLLTHPGSWPMKPDMGVGLTTYLFETYNTDKISNLQVKIRSQLANFLPSVQLIKVELLSTEDQKDKNFMNIRIIYSILGKTIASSITNQDSFGNLNVEPEYLDKNTSSFRDRAANLQSHLTEM